MSHQLHCTWNGVASYASNTFWMRICLSWFNSERRTAALWIQVTLIPKRSGGFDILPDRVTDDCSLRFYSALWLLVRSAWTGDSVVCMLSISNIGASSVVSSSVEDVAFGTVNSGASELSGAWHSEGLLGVNKSSTTSSSPRWLPSLSFPSKVGVRPTLGVRLLSYAMCILGSLLGSKRFRCSALSFPPPPVLTAYTGWSRTFRVIVYGMASHRSCSLCFPLALRFRTNTRSPGKRMFSLVFWLVTSLIVLGSFTHRFRYQIVGVGQLGSKVICIRGVWFNLLPQLI